MTVFDVASVPNRSRNWDILNQCAALLIAGSMGTIAFGLFGQGISPLLGGANLAPVPLAGSVYKSLVGTGSKPMAHILHYLAGVLCYPLAFALIGRPIWMRIAPWLPWIIVAIIFGVVQWVFALYIMAHLVAGMKPFLGWTGITFAALYGHIIYAIIAIGVSQHLLVSIVWSKDKES